MDLSPYTRKLTTTQYFTAIGHDSSAAAAAASSSIDMHRTNCNNHTSTTSRGSSDSAATDQDSQNWAHNLLRDCARAISSRDSNRIHHLLWMLNELSSPYGDLDQKLAAYFLQALFCKATESGARCYSTLTTVANKTHSFDAARRLILKFQEVSPWTTFGHVASNGAILEALEGEPRLHIVDVSNTLCTQWPTLLEALATRNDETPHLKLTVVALNDSVLGSVVKEVGQRMEKFARLMGVPFEFSVMSGLDSLRDVTREGLGIRDDEAVAVNCVGALRSVGVEERERVVAMLKSLGPKVVTVVEEEADLSGSRDDFVRCFDECLRFYAVYFEMLEESFSPTSNEKLMLERECSRSIVRVLACGDGSEFEEGSSGGGSGSDCCERREKGTQWCERLNKEFSAVVFSDDVVDDVKALLKRYRAGWSLLLPSQVSSENSNSNNSSNRNNLSSAGIYLTWKEEPVVWASAWKP